MIRAAVLGDELALRALWDVGLREHSKAPDLFRDGTFDDVMTNVIAGRLLVAEEDGRVIGMVRFDLLGHRYMIGGLVVDPAHRGNGVGSRLLDAATSSAKTLGGTIGALVVWDRKSGLRQFYKKAGYRKIGLVLEAPC